MSAQPPSVQQSAARGSKKLPVLALLVLVLLVGLGGGWLLLNRKKATNDLRATAPNVASSTVASLSQSAAAGSATSSSNTPIANAPAAPAADATAAAAATKPCSLVSQADMEQILGEKVIKMSSDETTCSYFTSETLSAEIASKWAGGRDAMSEAKGYNANPGLFEPVSGIGDEAYRQAAGTLHVLKGDVYVVINSREYPNDEQTESAIAHKAMEKLN